MRKIYSIGLLILLSLAVGCSTMEGLGKDVEKGGEAIQKAAKKGS